MKNIPSNIVPDSFIAISDFHSFEWPLNKLTTYYINEYQTIYILGDATDRGPYKNGKKGIEIISKIKKLTEQHKGRIVYIPGNHDSFLYDYGYHNDECAADNMTRNGGIQTYLDFEKMRQENSDKTRELLEWLGNLPLQRTHEFNGQKYALAHAFFNQKLYKEFPNFCLKDLYSTRNNKELYNRLSNVIWFRKRKSSYNPEDVPSNDTIIVIGHTPKMFREDQKLNLENSDGQLVEVFCVDGGITYNGKMSKYDGSIELDTFQDFHNDTSPKLEISYQMNKSLRKKM